VLSRFGEKESGGDQISASDHSKHKKSLDR
jgi:hypothetical protein